MDEILNAPPQDKNELCDAQPLSPSRNLKKSSKSQAALCFKVPLEFRRWFKHQALLKDMTMTELLVVAVENYLQLKSTEQINTEIRK